MSGLGCAAAKVGTFRPWRTLVLTVGTGLGAVCIVATIAMVAFGHRPLMFRSGFMSPTMDTGPVEGPGSERTKRMNMSLDSVPRRGGFWRSLRSDRVRALLSFGIVLGLGSVGTLAYWTDDATASGATFTSGTIDLIVGAAVNDAFDFSAMGVTNMVPGSTEAQTITVNNNGTAPFKYTVTSAATNTGAPNLPGALTWRMTTGTASGTDLSRLCTGGTVVNTGTGINGALISTGQQVAAAATQTLCFEVTLPAGALIALAGASTVATLTFTATSDLT